MNPVPARRRTPAQEKKLVKAYFASKLSTPQFCAKHKIPRTSLLKLTGGAKPGKGAQPIERSYG